jgi:hypothetical protein
VQEYFIWIIPFLLAVYSIRAFIRDSKKMKTPNCVISIKNKENNGLPEYMVPRRGLEPPRP